METLRYMLAVCALCLGPVAAVAQDNLVRLHAPAALVETGLLRHILPRFSLKTQVRVELVGPENGPATADMVLGADGRAVFEGTGQVWHMDLRRPDHPGTARLADWLLSDVGRRTVTGYAPEGVALFTLPKPAAPVVVAAVASGDAAAGLLISRAKCGRCHVVDAATQWSGIGSTPSFAVLRGFEDWQDRFATFYVLNPHPSFTIIPELTVPFPEGRPPAIVPVDMTLSELESVMAYVTTMTPADLGQPLDQNSSVHQ